MLARPLRETAIIEHKHNDVQRVDVVIACVFMTTILATMAGNVLFDIPPVLTFLSGLSVMFLLAQIGRASCRERVGIAVVGGARVKKEKGRRDVTMLDSAQ